MRCFILAVFTLGLLRFVSLSAQERTPTDQLSRELATLVRWRAFWEGKDSFKNYISGKQVEVAVVEAPNEIAAFVCDIGVEIFLQTVDQKISRVNIQTMGDETNSSAVNRYVAQYGTKPGFELKPGVSVGESKFPVRQDSRSDKQKRELLKQRRLWFRLPELTTPAYIRFRQVPPGLPPFESAVRSRVRGFYGPSCGRGEILIPYFSPSDPAIYVYADLGRCGKGIFTFVRDESGGWQSGQFSPAAPPNDWSRTIQQIRENVVWSVHLPAGL